MAMSFSTLTTAAWDTMYAHLQTGTYALTTNNIFSAFNDKLIEDKGLPIVVIRPPSVSIKNVTMNGTIKRAKVVYQIDAYHSTAESLKTLVDSIITKINTGYSVFAALRLKRPKNEDWFSTVNYDSWSDGTHRIHMYSIGVTFRYID